MRGHDSNLRLVICEFQTALSTQTAGHFLAHAAETLVNRSCPVERGLHVRQHVGLAIGSIAKPDDIRFAEALPKTRSGKIMRRLLKEIAGGGQVRGDTTTLEDFSVLARLNVSEE